MQLPTNPNPPATRFGVSLWFALALIGAVLLFARVAPALVADGSLSGVPVRATAGGPAIQP